MTPFRRREVYPSAIQWEGDQSRHTVAASVRPVLDCGGFAPAL
jgi:hypothetical protein